MAVPYPNISASSKINTYGCDNGNRVTKAIIDRNIRKAKENKTREFKNDHDFVYCEFTGQSSGTYIDIMHIISIKECLATGRANLCWDKRNLRFGTREYHNDFDKKSNLEREDIFNQLNE